MRETETGDGVNEVTPGGTPATDYFDFVAIAHEQLAHRVPDADSMANRVILTLSRATSQILYDMEASIHRPRGGSWSGYRLLFTLWLGGPMESNRTAHLSGLSRATVSNLTTRLVARGLLNREAAKSDGRAVTLSLTALGVSEMRSLFEAQNRREAQWAQALSETEQQTLVTLLEKLMSRRAQIDGLARD